MNKPAHPHRRRSQYFIVAIAFLIYGIVYVLYHDHVGDVISSLGVVPVIAAAWYFGIRGGAATTVLVTLLNELTHISSEHSFVGYHLEMSTVIGLTALFIVASVVGRLGTVTRERREALVRLETYERERQNYVNFLESLNEVTRTALEAKNLTSTLKVLIERIAMLFGADDAFFAFWDEENQITTPVIAYGSMSETYPKITYEPGEQTLTSMIIEAGRPLAIEDLKSSSISPRVMALFPSHSILGLPLIVQGKKLAAFYLGYNDVRHFERDELTSAEVAARQIALVLVKGQVLENVQKQVKQLTVLHEVALISTRVETADQLIERVTDIIGKNLFPNNFGILLMDEEHGVLRPHPSYRFGTAIEQFQAEIPLGEGVTGQVAQTGQSVHVTNVHEIQNYINVDQETHSELCVPIMLKDRVLGVINIESTRADAFSSDDELMLGTLAGQLATAIEQLRAAQAERRWLDQLAHSNDLIYSLAHITTHIEKAYIPGEIIQILGRELKQLNLTCAIAIYDSNRKLFTFTYTSMESEILEQLENRVGDSLSRYSSSLDRENLDFTTGNFSQPQIIPNLEEELQFIFAPRQKRNIPRIFEGLAANMEAELMRLPLMFEENLLGILWIWGKSITQADLPVMSIFAKQIGISLENARLFQEVQNLALTDPLTGLQNRRSLFELGRIEFSRAHRMNRPFCCMMLDLDSFKQINDNYGHAIGDQVLQEFAERCKRSVREVDLVGRYGGEEIVIFLPETDLERALQVAERLRVSMEEPLRVSDQILNATVSIGVSRKDENTLELETLIARADQAMYIAKHKGRNRVAISV